MGWSFALQWLATTFMTGVIWFVQLVHYPLFEAVEADGFPAYEARHQRWTTVVVIPPMVLELATATWSVLDPASLIPSPLAEVGLGLAVLVWASTILVQMPLHARLSEGKDEAVIDRLVATNWVRTAAWTSRSALLAFVAVTRAINGG